MAISNSLPLDGKRLELRDSEPSPCKHTYVVLTADLKAHVVDADDLDEAMQLVRAAQPGCAAPAMGLIIEDGAALVRSLTEVLEAEEML